MGLEAGRGAIRDRAGNRNEKDERKRSQNKVDKWKFRPERRASGELAYGYLDRADTTDNTITLTLPRAFGRHGEQIAVKFVRGSNPLTVETVRGETVDGNTAIGITLDEYYIFMSDGENWMLV